MSRVLVVAAHPDDEALGCAGTLSWHVSQGDEVMVFFLADGVGSRSSAEVEQEASARRCMAESACYLLGAGAPVFGPFQDNQMDAVPLLKIVKVVESLAERFRPDIVYTHHAGDLNVDHRMAHQAVLTAFRPLPGSSVNAIYAFEVCSSTEWAPSDRPAMRPTRFVDITQFLDAKRKVVNAYAEEMRPWPHARSWEAVEALARCRGATVGVEAAEAFEVIREICGRRELRAPMPGQQ